MLGTVADRALEPVLVAKRSRFAGIHPIVDHRRLVIDRNPGVARIAPVADLVRGRADLVERQNVMVGARLLFGIPKPWDSGVLVAVISDVDNEPRGAGADVGIRRLDAAAP